MGNSETVNRASSTGPASLIDQLLRDTWRHLQRNGILYLLSAFFMLLGCYLVCLPHLLEYKQISSLLTLLSVVNCYEIMVIAACVYILRRLPSSRESSTLIIVEVLFLFDATFTNNSCLAVHFGRGLLVLAFALALGFVKIYALESACGPQRPLFGESRGILLAGLLFTYSFQPVLAVHAPHSNALQTFMTHLVWVGYGVLPLFLRRPKSASTAAVSSSADVRAVFREENLQRVVMVIALLVPLIHVAGQSWVHRAPFEWEFLLPALVSFALTLPIFLNADSAAPYLRFGAVTVLGWSVLNSSASSDWSIHINGISAELSATRLNVLFTAASFAVAWFRSGRTSRVDLAIAMLATLLAVSGSNAESMYSFVIAPKAIKIFLVLLYSAAWIVLDRNYYLNSAVVLANVFLILQYGSIGNAEVVTPSEFYYYLPIVAFLMMLPFDHSPKSWAVVPYVTLFVCGCLRAGDPSGVALVYVLIACAALSAGYLLYERSAIYAVCAYLVIALLRRHVAGASVGISWGWLAILFAFALFALGFYVTRSHLQESSDDDSESESSPRPSSTLTSL